MNAQNQAERKSAFLRFILFFIITISLIIAAVYFGIQVPIKENDRLKEELTEYEQQKMFGDELFVKIKNTYDLLDTVNQSGINTDIIDGRITQNINDIDALVAKESIANKELYHQIIKNLTDRQFDKRMLRTNANMDQRLEEKQNIIDQLTKNRDSWKERADQLQQQIIMMQR